MPTTTRDAQALTYLVGRIRDETPGANHWDEPGIYTHVAALVGRNLALTIEQVTRHAADPTAKTPGAINRPFLPDAPTPGRQQPPKAHEVCGKHPAYRRTNCGGCAADELAGDDEPDEPTTYAEVEAAGATYAKALLVEAAADNCPHGIRRGLCKACGEGAK